MMDMETKYVYRFVSGLLVGVDENSVHHGTTKEITLAPVDMHSYKSPTSPVSDMSLLPATTTPPDDRFLREMMMQCLDDFCAVEFERFKGRQCELGRDRCHYSDDY